MVNLEYCALSYSNQWQSHDSVFYELLNSHNPQDQRDGIKEAASFYKIARNFAAKYDGCYRFHNALNELNLQTEVTSTTYINTVKRLADSFLKHYHRKNISAASKLLWLKHRDPVIIYDGRAINALQNHFHYEGRYGDYDRYCEKWLEEYQNKSREIVDAANRLPSVIEFVFNHEATEHEVRSLIAEEWFKKRVFDTYLWNLGAQDT